MDSGGYMKPTKKYYDNILWDRIFGKLKKLGTAIEMFKGGEMSIDDTEYRWVTDRLEYWNSEERILIKEDMQVANKMWNKYGS